MGWDGMGRDGGHDGTSPRSATVAGRISDRVDRMCMGDEDDRTARRRRARTPPPRTRWTDGVDGGRRRLASQPAKKERSDECVRKSRTTDRLTDRQDRQADGSAWARKTKIHPRNSPGVCVNETRGCAICTTIL